jgi:hypothetical protein
VHFAQSVIRALRTRGVAVERGYHLQVPLRRRAPPDFGQGFVGSRRSLRLEVSRMNYSPRVRAAVAALSVATLLACAGPAFAHARTTVAPRPWLRATALATPERVIYYYQTQYYNGQYQSLAPIWTHGSPKTHLPYATDVMIAAFHLGYDTGGAPYIHLNDNVPSDPMFDVMWPEVAKLRTYGVSTRMMLGGAAQGSYANLFGKWATFYPILKQTLTQYGLNGIDLDVEETVSLGDIEKLINRLRTDFGANFFITLSPVCSALWNGANLSGFNYIDLYRSRAGANIAWFNAQFYSGFGSMSSTADYEHVLAGGVFSADKVVAGVIANPHDGFGFIPLATLEKTVHALSKKHPDFGGVADWEYFDALPGGQSDPAKWAGLMAYAVR